MHTRLLTGIAVSLALSSVSWAADTWPARPVTLVIPFPAGGSADLTGRALANALSHLWKQPVVVENRGGAGGTIGASQVIRAEPDGYTLLLGTPADQVNAPLLMAKPPYDAERDLAPVGCVNRGFNVLAVNAQLPATSVGELIELAKSQPGRLHFGSAGVGNTSHLSGELFAQTANIELTHVPYRGNSPALADTAGGQVQMMFSGPSSVRPMLESGALRALAVTSGKRAQHLPDTPTLSEAGVPLEVYSWACVFAPAKTSAALIDRLSATLRQALDDPEVERSIASADAEKFPQTPEQTRSFLAAERKMWGDLIRTRNISAN